MEDKSELKHQYYLAIIPVAAYFCMLAFEAGRYSYFGIPFDYVEISSQRIAQLGFATVLFVLLFFILITHLVALAEASSAPRSFIGKFALSGIPLIILTFLLVPEWEYMLMAIGVSLMKATDPNFTQEQYDSFDEKKALNYEDRVKRRMRRMRTDVTWILIFIGYASICFFRAGELFQQYDETAIVKLTSQTTIVVGTFNGALVLKSFDIKNKKFINGFRLESIDGRVEITEKITGKISR